jgi:hypothetical protein
LAAHLEGMSLHHRKEGLFYAALLVAGHAEAKTRQKPPKIETAYSI